MFYWAAVFLIIAIAAAVLGLGGIAGISANIAWVLFIVGLIAAVIFFVAGRRRGTHRIGAADDRRDKLGRPAQRCCAGFRATPVHFLKIAAAPLE